MAHAKQAGPENTATNASMPLHAPKPHVVALTLKSRTFIFLTLSLIASVVGVFLMSAAQDRIGQASNQVREVLLPAGRLIEDAKSEIDLQIQELGLLSASSPQHMPVGPQNLGLLRLGPAVKTLMSLHSSPMMPQVLKPLFDPWAKTANEYQSQVMGFHDISESIPRLKELAQKTQLLHRAIDREFTMQLLELGATSREYGMIWSSAFLLTALLAAIYMILVWRWMSPLDRMRRWLQEASMNTRAEATFVPPPSFMGTGVLSAPAEIQRFNEALRFHVRKFQSQSLELETRSSRIQETEKAMGTLFSALQYLMRNNAELLDELIKKERLASMSEMAARLAHEIRNPLNSLNLKLELLREDLSDGVQRAQLDKVLVEIDRLDALTESHLRTTRAQLSGIQLGGAQLGGAHAAATPVPEAMSPVAPRCNVCEITESTLETLRPELESAGIAVECSLQAPEGLEARVPGSVLKAALMNLLKNAKEAVLEIKAHRLIRVRVENESFSGQPSTWSLTVLDSGCGFPAEFLKHPIQSFRTTKAHGSGLGLATTEKMLQAFGARIEIRDAESPFRTAVRLTGSSFVEKSPRSDLSLDSPNAPDKERLSS
jgi:signal transduction histidine kinase